MRRWMNEMPALLRQFAARWKTYLALHLAVALMIFLVLAPLSSLLLRLAVMLSGDAALSDQDIAWFILSPAGFIAFIVLAAIYSIVAFLEYAALIMTAWLVENALVLAVFRRGAIPRVSNSTSPSCLGELMLNSTPASWWIRFSMRARSFSMRSSVKSSRPFSAEKQ